MLGLELIRDVKTDPWLMIYNENDTYVYHLGDE